MSDDEGFDAYVKFVKRFRDMCPWDHMPNVDLDRHNHDIDMQPICDIHHIPYIWGNKWNQEEQWECPECEKQQDEAWEEFMGDDGNPR